MNVKSNKNLIYAGVFIAVMVLGYFIYSYFSSSSAVTKTDSDGIYAKNTDSANSEGGAATMPIADNSAKAASNSDSLARFEQISRNSNLSDFNGRDIYDLILTLEQVKLDIAFFNNEKFRSFVDFSKEIKVSDEEKGNINPFRPSSSVFYPASSGAAASSSGKKN